MRSVLRTPCAGGLAPSQRGRAWSRAPRQKTPGSIAVFAAGSSSHEASGRSSSPSRGASAAKAVASSGRSAVDAPTSSSSSSPEIVGPKSGNGAGAAAASSPSGPLLKAVRSSRFVACEGEGEEKMEKREFAPPFLGASVFAPNLHAKRRASVTTYMHSKQSERTSELC